MEDEQDFYACPQCDGPGVFLGQLGSKSWFRCRNCGWEFHEVCTPQNFENEFIARADVDPDGY